MYFILEMLGTVAFAVSGAMVAIEKEMDILGVIILGITTAIGGGIIRDVLIGVTPPSGLMNPVYALTAIVVSILVFIPFIRKRVNLDSTLMVFVDAVGLGTFTVIGCQAAVSFDNFPLELLLGVMTGVGGGVLRDVFAAQKPMIFVRHFYAMASLCGAIVYCVLSRFNESAAMVAGIVVIVILRMLAARFRWHLPKA